MNELVPIPKEALNPGARYIVPGEVPHFGGSIFLVPERAINSGLVIYASGLGVATPQPMAISVHPDFLYLANSEGMLWARQYQQILRVGVGSPVTVTVPIQTRQGSTGLILSDVATVAISFPTRMSRGEITLSLATFWPDQATKWVATINKARIEYEERFGGAA